jgi:hypothetical protein
MYTLDYPIYYRKGARRMPVSFCRDCGRNITRGDLHIADDKYGGYYEILDAVKNNGEAAISFEDAVKKAFNRNEGEGVLKQYLGCYFQDSAIALDDKRLWEFRYKLQYEEPRVRVVNSDGDGGVILVSWNKDHVEERLSLTNDLL